jgi:hypothetical protein
VNPQTIQRLTVNNYKGVQGTATIEPSGDNLVVISGRNGQGKSSFIDALAEIVDPKGVKLTSRPIHVGEDEAYSEINTDQARIRRTWKKDDAGKLEAWALDGTKFPSGRDFVLDAFGGTLFDPSVFVGLSDKDQRELLLKRVSLPFDPDELAAERARVYAERTDTGRIVKGKQAALTEAGPAQPDLPEEEQTVAALLAQLDQVRAHNANVDRATQEVDAAKARAVNAYNEVDRLRALYEKAAADYSAKIFEFEEAKSAATGLERKPDGDLLEQVANIEQVNASIRKEAQRRTLAAELQNALRIQAEQSAQIDAIDRKKSEGLAAAQFPVAGLGIEDDFITFNGIPFKQLNTATQTMIAFIIATATDAKIRLVIVKNGDMLDADSLANIRQIAEDRGYIVLVERDRDESRQIGVTFEAGRVVGA